MNATELLKEDHQEVMRMIAELESADDEAGTDPLDTEIFNRLNESLKMHTRMEEEIFYPAMEQFNDTRQMVQEAYKEHDQVDQFLARLATLAPNQEQFQDTLSELRDAIEHHVDEEEGELFPKAEELLDQKKLNEMGRRMQEMKSSSKTAAATMKRK